MMRKSPFTDQLALVAISGAALAFMMCSPALPQEVVRGPYLQIGTPTSVIVKWRTDTETNSSVKYGASPTLLSRSTNRTTLKREHEILLTGLIPDTKYFYSVGTITTQLAGGDSGHFFVTSPVKGTRKDTRIWVLGDSGTKNGNARSVRRAYYEYTDERHTDLWLMLGDNAYSNGEDHEYQAAVFDMYPEMLRKSVLWPTRGNHDRGPRDAEDNWTGGGTYYDIFTLPTAGEAGGLASGTEGYYSFEYGNIHLICLESTSSDLRDDASPMWTWLEEDLAANDQDWTIAFWHHPPYSKGSHDSDEESNLAQMRERALPILEAGGVDLVLCGHSHSYERSFLLDGHYDLSSTLADSMKLDAGNGQEDGDGAYRKPNFGPASNEGAVYVVAGSSGKIDDGSLDHPVMVTSMAVLGSVVLDVVGDKLDAKFIDNDGTLQDYFTIVKGDTIMDKQSGDGQIALVNSTLTEPFVVRVRDNAENPIAGVAINFEIVSGQGSLSHAGPLVTDSFGLASAVLTLSPVEGEVVVEASAEHSAAIQQFTATARLPMLKPKFSTAATPSDTDDPAIWIHPEKRESSVIIGTDKQAGIFVWDLKGNQLQQLEQGTAVNNVDLRQNVQWGDQQADIVVANLRDQGKLAVFKVNLEHSGADVLTQIAGANSDGNEIQDDSYGICLYKRPTDDALFVFERPKSGGEVRQYSLTPGTGGAGVTVTAVRDLNYDGGVAEGFLADDDLGFVYITEEGLGIHKYLADPLASNEPVALFAMADGIASDREGLALYACDDTTGYLVLSSQGNSTVKLYEREDSNQFVGTVIPLDDEGEGGLGTDGLDVTSFGVSADMPHGFLAVHNQSAQLFHIYDWKTIADSLGLCFSGNESLIGPRIQIDPASFDFGEVVLDSTKSFVLQIENSGDGMLEVNALSLTGDDSAEFEIKTTSTPIISPGNTRILSIAFTPTSEGSKSVTLQIHSNDPEQSLVTLQMTGVGVPRVPVSVDDRSDHQIPETITLRPTYPNPFNASVTIEYGLPAATAVNLIVYNVVGQPIRALVDEVEPAGFQRVHWNGKDDQGLEASSGIYYVRLKAGERRLTQRITLLR